MADDIIRRKVRGRKVATWPSWKSMSQNSQRFKARSIDDAYYPKGYKFDSVARIKQDHVNHRSVQDLVDDSKRRRIRHEPPGPRRDYLIKEHHYWVQNGRPVVADQNAHRKNADVKQDARGAWQDGKPMYTDYMHDNEMRNVKRKVLDK